MIFNLQNIEEQINTFDKDMRQYFINITGKTPEELITGEDVKKVEQNYKKLTKKQLKAIEEFS